jgi:hypothetical protein
MAVWGGRKRNTRRNRKNRRGTRKNWKSVLSKTKEMSGWNIECRSLWRP